jgi:hypothetical protein
LDISHVTQPDSGFAAAPAGSDLVKCCPSLQLLDVSKLQPSAELLAQLGGLSGLHTLRLDVKGSTAAECLQEVCRLTGLTALQLMVQDMADGLVSQLTQLKQLKQLTEVAFWGPKPAGPANTATASRQHILFVVEWVSFLSAVLWQPANLEKALTDRLPACLLSTLAFYFSWLDCVYAVFLMLVKFTCTCSVKACCVPPCFE